MSGFLWRSLIVLASVIVPGELRAGWKQEWFAELSYRERSGASLGYLLRAARGAFRDAAWIRAETPLDLRFLTQPLRVECLLVAAALVICIWSHALIPPRPDYPNLDRLVRFERDMQFLGFTNKFLRSPMLDQWRKSPSVEQVASYNLYVRGPLPYARVSVNFFDTLGVKPRTGRSLWPGDLDAAVVTDTFWRTRLHSDPKALGWSFRIGKESYRVVGVLGPTFAFRQCSFFAPLKNDTSFNTISLLKPGVTRKEAESRLPKTLAFKGARLQPLVAPFSQASISMAGALIMLGCAFLLLRWRRMRLYVCARVGVGLLSAVTIGLATARPLNHISPLLSVVHFWMFTGLCAAVVYFVLRDQRSRCPVCQERLRMPVPIGCWSSLILDRPATEYVCPAGHGVLFVSEALHDPSQWTVLDESWHDLFEEPCLK